MSAVGSVAMSVLSTEYLRYPVAARRDGAAHDPTSDPIAFAFPALDAAPATWLPGSWETDGRTHYARFLAGPNGTLALAAGDYDVWLRITDDPEAPHRRIGTLSVV